jgi:PAS domain S-box-containing protein
MTTDKKSLLKQQINNILENKEKVLADVYTKSLEQLVEDLKIYQYELEFQNDELNRIQQELEISRKDYKDLFHDAPLGYLVLNDQNQILQSNKNVRQFIDVDLYGDKLPDFRKFIKPDYQDKYHLFFHSLQRSLQSDQIELELITNQQQPLYVNISATVKVIEGKYLFHVALSDVSKRKLAERFIRIQQQELTAITENMTEMIVVSDLNGKIQYVSPSCRMLGFTPEDFLGRSIFFLIHPDEMNKVMEAYHKAMVNRTSDIIRFRSLTHSGKYIWVETSGSFIYNDKDELEKTVFVVRDISTLIEKEELEKEIEIKKNTLRFKQKFLASLSHEIRTPLTGVIGMVELLEKTTLDHDQSDYVCTIKNSSESLREIIDQVLDYSKIEAGKVKLYKNPFRINDFIEDARNQFSGMCNKSITLTTVVDPHLPPYIVADRNRMMQVVSNLFINSMKSAPITHLRLQMSLLESDSFDSMLIKVEISDSNSVIDKSLHDLIFTPFSDVEHIDTNKYVGIGLGLAICKELVELHGGEINLESEEGAGNKFWFTFRAEKVDPNEEYALLNSSYEIENPGRTLKILLVEDKAVTQKVVKLQLEGMGHEIVIAKNGENALELFIPGQFDLILMDIQMPVMDGITATRILRERHKNLPPIVGLSANAFEGDREKYMEQGLDDYLTKPVRGADFKKLMEKLFRLKK